MPSPKHSRLQLKHSDFKGLVHPPAIETNANNLLTIPHNVGQKILGAAAVLTCPLLGADKFISFCKDRSLSINKERLFRLEQLKLFAPVFRVLTPEEDVPPLSIPIQGSSKWFKKRWALDTTTMGTNYNVPNSKDRTQEAYYSIFQIDHLQIVLSSMTLSVEMDSYLELAASEAIDWEKNGKRWLEITQSHAISLKADQHRRAIALLCQFISNRYYPSTQGDQRRIRVPGGYYSDQWISVNALKWNWYEYVRAWKPQNVERLFGLTPTKLQHAYETLATSQAYCDPIESWYQLVQFIKLDERKKLKGAALRAETLRSGAHMLRLLYRDLYNRELPHPNEVTGTILIHIPELEIRKDTRRYLEFVVNRYGLNPQPTVSLIVEGRSEENAISIIFEHYFGAHPGVYGIEIIVLGGVDAATGTKEDRFRAIIRLIDYLHYHQTFAFLILDNERYARKLKDEAKKAKSIHSRRYVTRPEYIKMWKISFEFDNFSCAEIASVLTDMAAGKGRFSPAEINNCQQDPNPGARLKNTYFQKTGRKLDKVKMSTLLAERMLAPSSRRKINNRPLVKTLERVANLASRNWLPSMQGEWIENQASKHFGKKHR